MKTGLGEQEGKNRGERKKGGILGNSRLKNGVTWMDGWMAWMDGWIDRWMDED